VNVLVVDDSQVYLQFAKEYLMNLPEIKNIILCHDPVQVKTIVEQEAVDIILLDVMMPKLSGIDVLKQIRSDESYDAIPILMLTSLTDRESFIQCFKLGANDYITKPINRDEFCARVNVAIQTRKSHLQLKEMLQLTFQQNQELKEINGKLLDAKNNLMQAEKMAAIGQLAAGVAHEMNNPLGYISSNLESLKHYYYKIFQYVDYLQDSLSGSVSEGKTMNSISKQIAEMNQKLKIAFIREDLEQLFSETFSGLKRVTDIVLSLRSFAHTNEGEDKSLFELKSIMNQVLMICKNEAKHVAEVDLQIEEGYKLYGHSGQLAQVFMNVFLNAIQAIKSQQRDSFGKIKIWTTEEEYYGCVHISDDGPGIPESNYHKIFDPFFTTKEVGQGTGLGLSISYDIVVAKHKGKIEFKSKLGEGTEFIIKIPLVKESEADHGFVM
jgi:signal transduction histidine kinase